MCCVVMYGIGHCPKKSAVGLYRLSFVVDLYRPSFAVDLYRLSIAVDDKICIDLTFCRSL